MSKDKVKKMTKNKKIKLQSRNPIVLDLRSPKYRKRVEKNKKGKGSYNRQKKFSGDFFMSISQFLCH